MGVSLDSKQRTEARAEANAAKLDTIRLYTLTELEPILGVTHSTLQSLSLRHILSLLKLDMPIMGLQYSHYRHIQL